MSDRQDIPQSAGSDDPSPPEALAAWRPLPEASVEGGDALFEAIAGEVERERGPRAWLQSRPTWQRWTLALSAVFCTALLFVLLKPRPNLAEYPLARWIGLLGLMGVAMVLTVGAMLRPLHRPPLARWKVWSLALLGGLGAPALLALLPAHASALMDTGLAISSPCLIGGVLSALPLVLAMWLLVRSPQPLTQRLLLAGAGAGLAGNFVLEFHCPVSSASHLLVNHAPLSLAFLLLASVLASSFGARRQTG